MSRKRKASDAELADNNSDENDNTRPSEKSNSQQLAETDDDDFKETSGRSDESGSFEAGIILRVYMENFMCHRIFDVQLGKKVNFITGQNGSGKILLIY